MKEKTLHRTVALLTGLVPFILGGFFTWTACLITVVLAAVLWAWLRHHKTLTVSYSAAALGVLSLPVCYLLAVLWTQDRGMALPGLCRVLPLLLWAVLLWQVTPESREEALEILPWSGAVMTAVSLPLSYLPVMDGHLQVAGRQAGLFEYPNTYALFLLLGLLVLATRSAHRWYHGALAAVLLAGIFLSGSRTVFLLTALCAAVLAFCAPRKAVRRCIVIALPAAVAGVAAYALVTDKLSSVGRFLTTSLHSSTFLGRLLYARDALPVILRHPLGIGYGAYAAMQGSFQTGVYSVQSVHNDLLQLMLDAGWVPALLMAYAVGKTLFRRGTSLRRRLMLGAMCLHALLDFSLQYLSMAMVLVLLLDFDRCCQVTVKRRDKRFLTAVGGVLAAFSLYFAAVSGLAYLGYDAAAVTLDGAYTESLISLMTQQVDMETADGLATEVLARNRYVAPAWRIRAMAAYSRGDIQTMMTCQKQALACAPYDLTGYTDYLEMLSVGEGLYEQAGDTAGAETCRAEMRAVPAMLEAVRQKTSALGWLIDDKPELDLPEEYEDMISQIP